MNAKTKEKNKDYILEIRNITKRFPGVTALDDVSLSVVRGCVHVIVGENGAGKSTLMKIINGIYKSDSGDIIFDGQLYQATSPTQSQEMGISMIFQELTFIPELTIAENIFLGREPMHRGGVFLNNKKIFYLASELLKKQNIDFNVKSKIKNLSVSEKQIIEIIKALSSNSKLIIMDEPTSALTESEVDYLFKKIRDLKKQGVTIIYISHKLDEVFQVADYISVFRDGKHIETDIAKKFDISKVIKLMVGRTMGQLFPKVDNQIGDEIFRIEGFSRNGKFKDISFNLKRGEILGISGLMGSGRTEIVRAIFGLDKKDKGKVFIDGKEIKISSVSDAINNGIAMLSEDRRKYGLIPVISIKDNISLVALMHKYYSQFLKHTQIREDCQKIFKKIDIRAPNLETQVQNLSGGNQQKVVVAKWLLVSSRILILDEPTRGIDVGAKHEIHKLMGELTSSGKSIIMISSELPELIGMSDRVIVISNGRITGNLSHSEVNPEKIMHFSTGGS